MCGTHWCVMMTCLGFWTEASAQVGYQALTSVCNEHPLLTMDVAYTWYCIRRRSRGKWAEVVFFFRGDEGCCVADHVFGATRNSVVSIDSRFSSILAQS